MDKNYPMREYPYDNGDSLDWVAEFPDLQGCIGAGNTIEEAIPAPSMTYLYNYSGKFNLRIPKSLHRDLALKAELEGVSLNTYCIMLLSQHDRREK